MAQEIIQTINVDLGNSPQKIGDLRQNFETASKSVDELKQDVKELTGEINALTAAERAGSPGKVLGEELKAAQIELKAATEDVKKLTAATVESGEVVAKTGNVFTKAFSSLRQLAYLLPGIGIAGILGGLVEVIVKVFTEITSKTKDADIALKAYNDTLAATGKEIGNTVVEVQKMTTLFDEAKQGIVSKDTVLIEYNKHFGDTLGVAQDYNEAEKLFVSKSDAYVKAMQQRAIADAAYELEKKALSKAIEEGATRETTLLEKTQAFFKSYFTGQGSIGTELFEITQDNINQNNKLAETYHNIATAATQAGDVIAKAAGINLYGKDKPKKGPTDNSLDEQQRYLDESQKILQDAEEKEITSENIKYQKIYDDLVKHHHSTEVLEEQHLQNIADIHTKYALKAEADANKAFDEAILHKQQRDEKAALRDKLEAEKEEADRIKQEAKDQAARDKAEVKALNDELAIGKLQIQGRQLTRAAKLAILDQERKDVEADYQKGLITYSDYQKKIAQIDAAALKIKKLFSQEQEDLIHATEDLLIQGAKALGENTAAGKDLAIAAATIKALEAEVNIISNLSEVGPWGFVAGIAAAAAVGVGLFNTIKEIENVDIPGQGGSSSSINASSPSISYAAPVVPQATNNTNLSAASLQQINQANQQPVRAYVLESEISDSQARVTSYRNASRVGR